MVTLSNLQLVLRHAVENLELMSNLHTFSLEEGSQSYSPSCILIRNVESNPITSLNAELKVSIENIEVMSGNKVMIYLSSHDLK